MYHKYSNEEEAFANFMQNPSLSTHGKALGARVLNQATSVESWSAAVVLSPRRGGVKYSDDLVKAAQKLYPKKAGKIELHHPAPQYLGGAKKQTLVPLDAAYHQVITNEFRGLYQYGLPRPGEETMLEIMKQVYSKYPLPSVY
ncbi:MAG: hypothetical protein ACK5L5_11150 [Bacteroidales bacterium]